MDIRNRVTKIVSDVIKRELSLDDVSGKNLIEEFGISSVDALEILIRIEGEFDIIIDDSDLSIDLVSSIDTLESYISGKMEAA